MASVAKTVKDLIVEKINTLPSVQVVYKHEEVNPSGFPAVSIVATAMEGAFFTTSENRRIYSYRVFVHFPIGQNLADVSGDRYDNAEDVVQTVVDQIVGVIDDDYILDDPSGATVLFAEAVDSDYQYTELSTGWAKTALCTIRVHTDYNLPNSAFLLDEQGQPILEETP